MHDVRTALIQTLQGLSEKQAFDLVLALGQWADNQRNYIDDCDPAEVEACEKAKLAVAEKFVEAGEAALNAAVERILPLQNLSAPSIRI